MEENKLVRIKEIDGIPCIIFDDELERVSSKSQDCTELKDPNSCLNPEHSFSSLLDKKTAQHSKSLMDELKDELRRRRKNNGE
ncbi:MAG: hypothetical protein BAJALOKI1v1_710006 [Promethearchaeota archaeon]|nr:MAG: hypothetical protein BAJALOKI1v1_710006 [Candidatus Lokiarchaeota archaeon]